MLYNEFVLILTSMTEQVQPDTVVSMVDSSDHWGTLTAPTGAKQNDLTYCVAGIISKWSCQDRLGTNVTERGF